jgi:2-enoate reductase
MKLFEPGKIGKLEVKNRIVMAPMGIIGLVELDGRISQRGVDYYVARAKGGVGLITTGMTYVEHGVASSFIPTSEMWSFLPRIDEIGYKPRLAELADAVHDYGTKISIQLTAGLGRVAMPHYKIPAAPSAVPLKWDPKKLARELTIEQIKKLIAAFGPAAALAREAGMDAIELHGHEGYLLDQFQTALWNKRTDKYGGDLEGRLRFPLEVIETIKKAVGRDFPVIYRYGIRHYIEGGREDEESLEMAKRFETEGVDALHVDAGCYETWHWPHPPTYQPPGCMVDCAEIVKKVVSIPVFAVGKLGYPELAERVLQEGKADFIVLGRALLADPEWPNKVREGKWDEIRPCIGGHDGCMFRVTRRKYISCTVNPATGNERELTLKPAEKSKSVLVVGGGPGGMEAARVAALRGHQVTLWEKNDRLGGNLIPASVPDFKSDLRVLINYLSNQLRKLNVDVRLGKEGTLEMIQEMCPDVVIVATGATPIIPKIPGAEKSIVATAIDVLLGKKDVAENIVVVGGGLIGCETAAFLAGKGKKVTIVEMVSDIIPDEYEASRSMIKEMFEKGEVEVLTDTTLLEIDDDGVIVDGKPEGKRKLEADSVVLAMGMKPRKKLEQALEGKVAEVRAIGNCAEGRKVIDAMWEAFRFARLI